MEPYNKRPVILSHKKLLNAYKEGKLTNMQYTSCSIMLTDFHYRRGRIREFVPFSTKAPKRDQIENMSSVYYKILNRPSAQKASKILLDLGLVQELIGPKFTDKYRCQLHGKILKLNFFAADLIFICPLFLNAKKVKKYRDWMRSISSTFPIYIDRSKMKKLEERIDVLEQNRTKFHYKGSGKVSIHAYNFFLCDFESFVSNQKNLEFFGRSSLKALKLSEEKE